MTYATVALDHFTAVDRRRARPAMSLQAVLGAAALAVGMTAGVWMLGGSVTPPVHETPPADIAPPVASKPEDAPLDPALLLGFAAVPLGQSLPLGSDFIPAPQAQPVLPVEVESIPPIPMQVVPALSDGTPIPMPRPPDFRAPLTRAPLRSPVRQRGPSNKAVVPAAEPPDTRTFIEKLFGIGRPSGAVLGYATPESSIFDNALSQRSSPLYPYDRWTAVYDIAAHTVYMPNGAKLEAHSGLGDKLDDPRHVSVQNRGATPPHVYDLSPREQLFHGVQALRLNPVGNGGIFGRTGLLAHSYMLGPNGDSNGCVSFRNYNAFLQAFSNGEVKRLVVVAGRN